MPRLLWLQFFQSSFAEYRIFASNNAVLEFSLTYRGGGRKNQTKEEGKDKKEKLEEIRAGKTIP